MTTQKFTARIEKSGSKTVIALPFDPNKVWGSKKRHHISGTVNGFVIRGPLSIEGNRYFLPLGASWIRDNPLDAGAAVEVILSPEGPQSELLAEDIAGALAEEPQAKAYFDGLATFYRKNYLRWIESAKRPETRAARIAEMVGLLKAGKKEK